MDEEWKVSSFRIGRCGLLDGVEIVSGYEYRGLGLHMEEPARPARGKRKATGPVWHLSHLETGHLVHRLRGDAATVFPVATEIACCTDWTFSSIYGWKDRDPELPNKVREFAKKHACVIAKRTGVPANEEIAREISHAR